MTADYSKLHDDLFDKLLNEVVDPTVVMTIPGVHELVLEYYTNAALELFEERYPELAFPNGEGEDE